MTLTSSVISSFTIRGFRDAATRCRILGVRSVDLYAFMQADLIEFFPSDLLYEATGALRNAVQVMSAALDRGLAYDVATRIHAACDGLEIVAVATFAPEIVSCRMGSESPNARRALLFLVQLIRELRGFGHLAHALEFVGGCCVDGVWLGGSPVALESDTTYILNRASRRVAMSRLFSELEPIAQACASDVSPVFLALELEPGPLFIVNDGESLLTFCQMANDHESAAVRQTLGVNLDIPHWGFLTDISPEWLNLRSNRPILDRVIHAHISDHSKGHFCDAVLGSHHSRSAFEPWLQLLATQVPTNGVGPRFSGYVALELECCRTAQQLVTSLGTLNVWLGDAPAAG